MHPTAARCTLIRAGVVCLAWALPFSAGCSGARYGAAETGAPSIVLPIYVAEGNTGKKDLADAGTAPAPAPSTHSTLPDPTPLRTTQQWQYDLHYDKGVVRVVRVTKIVLPQPSVTPRRLGRFAVELWLGKELLDRVRFDFPLLAGDPPPEKPRKLPRDATRFGPGAETDQRVLVPDSDRATLAVLVDRLTGESTPLAWPPTRSADAGN